MDEVGRSVASKKRKGGCPSSGLTEQEREKDWSLIPQNIKKQKNDFFEKFQISSVEHLEMPKDDYIELDDCSFNIDSMPKDDYIELDDCTFNIDLFGSLFDGQSHSLGGKEAVINESPDQYKNERLTLRNIKEASLSEHVNQDLMPIDDFIELADLTSFNTLTFGSLFDGQSSTNEGEEAVMNESPYQYKFGSFFDGQASVLGRKEAAMNEPPVPYKEIGSLGSKSHTIFNT